MPVAQRMTAEEFVAAPVPEHGRPWNLIDGEVVVNEPTRRHLRVQRNILFALESWSREAPGRGSVELPADVAIDDRNVFAPDLLWWDVDRVPPVDAAAPYPMPALAVEVRSPSTWRYDVGVKKATYERHGLPELWLVDTAASTVLVLRRSRPGGPAFDIELELGEEEALDSPLLPGFELTVGDLFGVT